MSDNCSDELKNFLIFDLTEKVSNSHDVNIRELKQLSLENLSGISSLLHISTCITCDLWYCDLYLDFYFCFVLFLNVGNLDQKDRIYKIILYNGSRNCQCLVLELCLVLLIYESRVYIFPFKHGTKQNLAKHTPVLFSDSRNSVICISGHIMNCLNVALELVNCVFIIVLVLELNKFNLSNMYCFI